MKNNKIDNSSNNLLGWLDNVTKAFGQVVAVSEVSFAIPKGSIMGFLGPNGSGKTTSIRMMLGLIKPQLGEVRLLNENPFTNSKIKQNIGYVPEYSIFPNWIKAKDFLSKFSQLNLPREEAKKRALEILEQLMLKDVADKKIIEFSKGMKQRMKLAQALIHRPQLVIADEPFNGLDPVIRKHVFDLIREYRETYDVTFFVSSHILFEIDRLADQIVLLYKGRAIAQGAPKKIRSMIQEQPHSIEISSPVIQQISSLLINHLDEDIISSLQFSKNPRTEEKQLIVTTLEPMKFYHLFTELIADNEIFVREIRPTDEGLESLFQSLTIG
ncbi:MAG: putative ABC transporter ATP-binding protein YxlF [Candidatus Heimdallarchaeota archaeon LC_3]|nr:MAG: putative ABC transporter ATP-binding protein YxlF [Candidatus Heimdallarchaeota archaeon LC_3]